MGNGLTARYAAIRLALMLRGWNYRMLGTRTGYSEAAIKAYMARLRKGKAGSKTVGQAIEQVLGGVIDNKEEQV